VGGGGEGCKERDFNGSDFKLAACVSASTTCTHPRAVPKKSRTVSCAISILYCQRSHTGCGHNRHTHAWSRLFSVPTSSCSRATRPKPGPAQAGCSGCLREAIPTFPSTPKGTLQRTCCTLSVPIRWCFRAMYRATDADCTSLSPSISTSGSWLKASAPAARRSSSSSAVDRHLFSNDSPTAASRNRMPSARPRPLKYLHGGAGRGTDTSPFAPFCVKGVGG
jgi:hypothetical protein